LDIFKVTAAAKQAVEEYKRLHPDVDVKDLAVDLPKIPADPNPNPNPRPPHPNPNPNPYPNLMWAPVVNVPRLPVPLALPHPHHNRVQPPNLRPPVAHHPARRRRRVR
jgi:E3 ubiquitin-protein ligase RNF216